MTWVPIVTRDPALGYRDTATKCDERRGAQYPALGRPCWWPGLRPLADDDAGLVVVQPLLVAG